MIYEPKWRSLLANTTGPIFSPQQCQDIINMGHQQKAEEAKVGHTHGKGGKHDTKKRITTISWIPFKALPEPIGAPLPSGLTSISQPAISSLVAVFPRLKYLS